MNAKKLQEIAEKANKSIYNNICKNFKDIEKILKKYAQLGFGNCSIVCSPENIRLFEKEAISRGLRVYTYINEDNNGQLDFSWWI